MRGQKYNVWMVMPTANPKRAKECIHRWHCKGYHVAILGENKPMDYYGLAADLVILRDDYKGYWASVNELVGAPNGVEMTQDTVVVAAADDIDPDPSMPAQQIAAQYLESFDDGFGIMQPCGDPQGVDRSVDPTGKPAAARICGSPWFGKGWADRAFGGKGPFGQFGFFHFYMDELLKDVAARYEALWMRPDLVQYHWHWSWHRDHPRQPYQERNSKLHWAKDKALYEEIVRGGYKGCAPRKDTPKSE